MRTQIVFITPGCFDKGGISRYSRYQIQALRALYGQANVYVMSLMGPLDDSIEEHFTVNYAGKSNSKWDQLKFAFQFIWICFGQRPKIIHAAHVNFSGLSYVVSKLIGAVSILNVYGLEIWSKLSWDAAWGLKNVDHIISDCHNTKNYMVSKGIRKNSDIEVIWDCIDLVKFKPQSIEKISDVAKKYALPSYTSKKVIMTLGRVAYAARHKG
nr:glycosyltransferase [Saprospiraceae bacterium]